MNEAPLSQADQNTIFSRLSPQAVEQFHHNYQLWRFEQRIAALRAEIDDLQRRITENREAMRQVAPSPIALASLARLRLHDVNDPALLDRLLAQGDEWLDRTIQRLDYCERMGLIGGDYTQWCEHALDGAYDWIISFPEESAEPPDETSRATDFPGNDEAPSQTTEEMLLRKLMSEESDTPTHKIAAVPATPAFSESEILGSEGTAADQQEPVAASNDVLSEQVLPDEATIDPPAPEAAAVEVILPSKVASPLIENETEASNEDAEVPDHTQPVDLTEIPAAPGEQYEFPTDLTEMTPIESDIDFLPTQPETAVLPPESSTSTPFTQAIGNDTPTPLPPRPPRRRTLWQKLLGR